MKRYLAIVIGLALTINEGFAVDPMIIVEDTGLDNPSEITWPPQALKPGTAADGGELLRSIPGISGGRMGGHGIEPIIRGQNQTRLNILLDGAYVHGGCPNRMDPPTAYAAIESYDKITVIKGSHTVLYGGGGSGGTVLFERETPRFGAGEKLRGKASAGYRSNSETKEIAADVAAGGPQGFVRGVVGYADAENYDDGDGNKTRTAYTTRDGTLILGYTPDNDTRLELSYAATRERDVLFPGAGMDSPETDNDTVNLKFKRDAEIGPLSALRAELYQSKVDHLMDNFSLRTLTAPMKMAVPSESDTTGGKLIGDIKTSSGITWSLGVDHQKNNRDADRFSGPKSGGDPKNIQSIMWPDADLKQTGLFAEIKMPFNGGDTLKAGIRYDQVKSTIGRADKIAKPSPMLKRSPNQLYQLYYGKPAEDHDEDNIGGFVTYEHALTEESAIFATLSRSMRTADATERFLAGDNAMNTRMRWIGNPDLDPERHHQLELGMSWNYSGWDAAASVYYNKVDDYILRDRAHGQTGILQSDNATIYRNVDATLYGFELDGGIRWGNNWSSRATLAFVHAENDSDNRPIAQTPPLEGTVSLEYTTDRWSAGTLLRAHNRQNRVEDNPAENSGLDARKSPGWVTLDLYGSYSLSDNLTLKAGIDNLLDKSYAYHVNRANSDPFNPDPIQVNEPGRSFWLRLNASF